MDGLSHDAVKHVYAARDIMACPGFHSAGACREASATNNMIVHLSHQERVLAMQYLYLKMKRMEEGHSLYHHLGVVTCGIPHFPPLMEDTISRKYTVHNGRGTEQDLYDASLAMH
jgi:hypothetical protein